MFPIKEKYTLIRWKSINISIEPPTALKLFQYISFSSLGIITGYCINSPRPSHQTLLILIGILPSLYVFNHLFYVVIYKPILKYIIPKLTWIETNNRENIVQSHAILLNLVAVYVFFAWFLSYDHSFSYNAAVLSIFMIYTLLFFLHRALRPIDTYLTSNGKYNLVSFLKYKASDHVHVFAAATVGLPFLVGASLTTIDLTMKKIVVNGSFSYLLFIYSWIVFYQHKYKASKFLDSYLFILPTSFYPAFPILFFMFFHRDMAFFYTLFVLSSFLYCLPLLYNYTKYDSFVRSLCNEKIILSVLLGFLAFVSWQGNATSKFDELLPVSEFSQSGLGLFVSIFAIIWSQKVEHTMTKYLRSYFIMPYVTLTLAHTLVWLIYWNIDTANVHRSCIGALSNYLSNIEMVYVCLYVVGLFFLSLPFRRKKGGD